MFRVFVTTVVDRQLGTTEKHVFNDLTSAVEFVNSVDPNHIVTLVNARRRGKILLVR